MRKSYSRSHANRGMKLEKLIDQTNKQYINREFADVRKIPTPVRITNNAGGKISGFVTKGELVDYIGVCHGRTVIFDAKETRSRTSFAMSNIADHQYETLMSWWQKGAHAFFIVCFSERGEYYLLDMGLLTQYREAAEGGGRKSIPYQAFVDYCEPIQQSDGYALHYLGVLA